MANYKQITDHHTFSIKSHVKCNTQQKLKIEFTTITQTLCQRVDIIYVSLVMLKHVFLNRKNNLNIKQC